MSSAQAVILPAQSCSLALPSLAPGYHCGLDSPGSAAADQGLQQRYQLTQLHDSLLNKLLAQLDTRSKCTLMATCAYAKQLLSAPQHWRELAFDTANEQHGLDPTVLFSLLKRSQGCCEVIQLARCGWRPGGC